MTSTDSVPASTTKPTLRQIMVSFAYLAYCGQDITHADPEPKILALINSAMPKIWPIADPNPTWNVVWGPVTYTVPGALYQDNMMFVAKKNDKSGTPELAIVIRGTNFLSDLDWLLEDLDIFQMIPSATAIAPGASGMISESTSIDLQILLAMKDLTKPTKQQRLLDYLGSLTSPSNPINVCVTGHSLGGCVAGTFALYLKDNRGQWDMSTNQTSVVSCVTFAAPTAGNADFAAYSDQQFNHPNQPPRNWYPGWDQSLGTDFDAVRCSLDVAWMAWTTYAVTVQSGEDFPPLMNIYKPNLDFEVVNTYYIPSTVLKEYVWPFLIGIMTPRDYKQVVHNAPKLTGIYAWGFAPDPPPPVSPTQAGSFTLSQYLWAFFEQARYQHSRSYPILLGVKALNDPTIIVTSAKPNALIPPTPDPIMAIKRT